MSVHRVKVVGLGFNGGDRLPLRWHRSRESGGIICQLPRAAELIAVLGIVPGSPAAYLGYARTLRICRAPHPSMVVKAEVLLDVLFELGPP